MRPSSSFTERRAANTHRSDRIRTRYANKRINRSQKRRKKGAFSAKEITGQNGETVGKEVGYAAPEIARKKPCDALRNRPIPRVIGPLSFACFLFSSR